MLACYFFSTSVYSIISMQNDNKFTYYIQLPSDSQVLVEIKDTISPIINNIVKEELGLSKDFDFNFFLPKKPKPQYLSVYYLNDIN